MNLTLLKEHYIKHFGDNLGNIRTSYCPYRICPLGAHVDHQLGLVTGFALDKGISFYYSATSNGKIDLYSYGFNRGIHLRIDENLEKKDDWGNYIRGALYILRKHYTINVGIKGYIHGELPVGGLSSSAAVIISFLKAIAEANYIELTDKELIDFAYFAEVDFVGMSIGKLDQSCEVLSKKNELLFLDTKTGFYETIPFGKEEIDFKFLIVYSGAARKLENSAYNTRVDECKSASYFAKAFLNKPYQKYKDTYLRDVSFKDYELIKDKLPENFRKRADHFYNENERVNNGIKAWKDGDIKTFGKIVFESGASSIELYEAGSKPLISLYEIMKETKGVLGGRFMGGGFNGCCLAICEESKVESVMKKIKKEYLARFPEYKESFDLFICESADGAGEL